MPFSRQRRISDFLSDAFKRVHCDRVPTPAILAVTAIAETLDDGTEIVHSETLPDGRVKVYIEKPDEKDGFHHATCYLPGYEWQDIFGFSEAEMDRYQDKMERTAHIILRLANEGGFEGAEGV